MAQGDKTTKYQDSVRGATGKEIQHAGGGDVEVIDGADFGQMVIDDDKAKELITKGKWEFAPKVGGLEVGKAYMIFIEGNGPVQELIDKTTHEPKMVPTWIVASPDKTFRLRLLGSYDLNQKLAKVVGEMVIIKRHPDKRLNNGNMFTEYDVAVAPRADGKRREWTEPKQIEAHVAQRPELAAGMPNGAGNVPHEDLTA